MNIAGWGQQQRRGVACRHRAFQNGRAVALTVPELTLRTLSFVLECALGSHTGHGSRVKGHVSRRTRRKAG